MTEHLTEARRIRVSQAHETYQLQHTEAGLREAEIMVSRERDSYYEELVTQVQHSSLLPFHPTAVAVSTPAPGHATPASSSVLATATLPATTNPPIQYAPASATYPTQPVQQQQQPSPLQQQQTQPAMEQIHQHRSCKQQQLPGGSPLQTPGVGISQVPLTPASGSGDPWWARAATLPSVLGPAASAVPPGLGCSHVSTPSIGCNMASASVVQPNPIACPWVVPQMPMYPPGYPAPPSVPPTAHPSQGATPYGASPADDFGGRVKATPAKLPRLEMKATDASKITLQIQNWVVLCQHSINTWGQNPVLIWLHAVAHAEQSHARYCSLTPAQRAMT
eukprot:785048-Amphidinium_carterae.1